MSDQEERSNVRRLGRKDRKRRLDPRGPLFPPDEPAPEAPAEPEVSEPPAPAPKPAAASDLKPRFNARATSEIPVAERFPPLNIEPHAEPVTVPKTKTAPARRGSTCLPNLVAIFFLLATIAFIGMVAIITANPYSALNPFPPFTPLPEIVTATFLPPTATLPPTAGPTATFTPIPLSDLNTPETTSEAVSGFTFALANAAPVYAPNGNDQGCNWSSIAGTVTDASGTALNGYGVHVTGAGVDSTVFSGAALTFGAGGFELFLNGTPQANTYTVQLVSPQGTPVSDTFSVSTQASCDQNVAILTFKEVG